MMASGAARNFFKLYVTNIPWTVGHVELKQYFSKFGHINSAVVSFDKNTGLSRHFGFVFYSTKEGFETALNTPNHKLEGVEMAGVDLNDFETECDDLNDEFNKAADHVKNLVSNIDSNKLLALYGFYKQASDGPCNTPKPSWYDTKAKAKWNAWDRLKDLSPSDAKLQYIQLVKTLDPNYNSHTQSSIGWVSVSTLQTTNEPALNHSEKSLTDFVKEGNLVEVKNIFKSLNHNQVKELLRELDDDGLSLIHWAADRGSADILDIIISFGGDVNLVDVDSQTALHYAASCGHVDCIAILLKNGANLSLKDADGLDPKSVANDDSIRELLDSYH